MAHSPSAISAISAMSLPGALNIAHQRDHGSAPRLSGAKSHIFRPPRTYPSSASSSMILTRSTTSIISTSTTNTSANRLGGMVGTRKRSRPEAEMPRAMEEDWSSTLVNSTEAADVDVCPGSPTPFVNTKYVLAGGMDTPTMKAAQLALVGENEYSDAAYRSSLGENGVRPLRRELLLEEDEGSYFPGDGLGRDVNGRGRGWNGPANDGWSKTAMQVVGGVVGKVWEFCKHGGAAFRGFQAGGGTMYTINEAEPIFQYQIDEMNGMWGSEKFSTWGPPDRESTPLPGRFPEEDFIPDYLEYTKSEFDARPAKRRQVSRNNPQDEIAKNWVVVQPPSAPVTPSRPQPRAPVRPGYAMGTTSSTTRRSMASSARPAFRAGFASTAVARKPLLSRGSHAGSPALNSGHGASFASPRSSPGSKIPRPSPMRESTVKVPGSPAAKEAQRWAAMKKKEDREADESIRRLDQQLKAMIKEGKEALGTKVEVEMEDDIDMDVSSRKWAI